MYGMLLESVQHFVRSEMGEGVWSKVLEEAGYKNAVFTTHQIYPECLLPTLATACTRHCQPRGEEDYLFFFGQCFVLFFSHYGYDNLIRATGRYFRDFLHGIDNLHHQIRFSYPKMRSPSFYIETEDAYGCILHYRSKRNGFASYVKGQLHQIAKTFYNLELEVEVMQVEEGPSGSHVVFELKFDNQPWLKEIEENQASGSWNIPELEPVSTESFFRLFPFGLTFDPDLKLQVIGDKTMELFGNETLVQKKVDHYFHLHRPRMDFTWETIMTLQKVVVELECQNSGYVKVVEDQDRRQSNSVKNLLLKGQMRFIPEWNAMVYLCVPLLGNIREIQEVGLYLTDLCLHDGSRELVLAGWQHAARLEANYEKLEERSKELEDNLMKLDQWRQRSDDLLYSMIPKQIAERLRNGVDPIHTCQAFKSVTVLFSELVEFSQLCKVLLPLQAVDCINDVFSHFDKIIDKYDVYKVETVGQVYMLVSGAPDKRKNHVENVASASLDILAFIKKCSTEPVNKQNNIKLALRSGIHSGNVAAGVVGKKMLRYCFFGDTVNTAARMQTHGEAGKIHISEPCFDLLPKGRFNTTFRGTIPVKGKGDMRTYWLDSMNELV